jgi:hypothetical protein
MNFNFDWYFRAELLNINDTIVFYHFNFAVFSYIIINKMYTKAIRKTLLNSLSCAKKVTSRKLLDSFIT